MTSFSATTPPTEAELERAASLTVKSESGEAVTLGSLYGEQKTICIFIRHFVRPAPSRLPYGVRADGRVGRD